MNTYRKPIPSRALLVSSILIAAIIGCAIYYAFTEGGLVVRIVAIIAATLILLPILKMPIRVYDDGDNIRVRQIVGEKLFLKNDYTIRPIQAKGLFSIRMFATSVFVNWGFLGTKSLGTFYALCVGNTHLILLTKKSDESKIVIDGPSE